MELEIRPEPTPAERQAILVALERVLPREREPEAYLSAWRRAAIEEELEPEP